MSLIYRVIRDIIFSDHSSNVGGDFEIVNPVDLWVGDGLGIVASRHGRLLVDSYDYYLGAAILNYGECSEIEVNFLLSLLAPGDTVIEIGANFGYLTVPLAKHICNSGQLIAVEPQERIYYALCANLALNQLGNVRAIRCGCGEASGVMIAPEAERRSDKVYNSGGVSLVNSGAGATVDLVTVDYLSKNLESLKLLKIDVEGMERLVLLGARETLAKFRPMLYVENDRVDRSKELIKHIIDLGYRLWWHIPKLFNDNNFFRLDNNIYGNVHSFNMICIPAEMEVPAVVMVLNEVTEGAPHPLESAAGPTMCIC